MLLHFSLIKLRVPKPRLWKSAPSSEQSAALSHRPEGNARMRAPLLLFPKISLRCDFREPCCRILATHAKGVNAHDFNNFLQKAKPRFCLLHFTPRGRRTEGVNARDFYNA